MPSRVPKVTGYFWTMNLLVTMVGVAAATVLTHRLGVGLVGSTATAGALLIVALAVQARVRRYLPPVYWLVVASAGMVGELLTDTLVHGYGVAIDLTMILWAAALAAVFTTWDATEKTLSIRTVYTNRREVFYWLAVMFSFALGTAIGDVFAELGLGYLLSCGLFVLVIALVGLAHVRLGLHPVPAFWTVYVLACPLGAKLWHYLADPYQEPGGLGLGLEASAYLMVAGLVLVVYLTAGARDALPAGPDPTDPVFGAGAPGSDAAGPLSEAAFVERYYAKLPQHTGAAFDDLTPAFQRRIGGVQGFNRRYRDVQSVVIVDEPVLIGPHTVSVSIRSLRQRGRTTSERLLLRIEPYSGGVLRLDDIIWRS
jgi:uncharacterized membrane-anchored protein